MGTIWRRWLKVAEILGNLQMAFFLTLIYWTLWSLLAIPFKFLADPLSMRRLARSQWVERTTESPTLESMRKQG